MFAQQRYCPERKPPQLPTAYADVDLIYQRNWKKTQWKQQSINRHVHAPPYWSPLDTNPGSEIVVFMSKAKFWETMKLAYSIYPWLRKLVMICELCKTNIQQF